MGDRISQTVGTDTTEYLLDLTAPLTMMLGEFGPTSADDTYYLLGLDIIGQQQDSTWSYFGYDGLGSVRQVYSSLGAVGYTTSYAPYGDPFEQYGDLTTTLGFTGEYTDPTGLLFLRARYLNTDLGMFLSRDPFEGVMDRVMSRNGYSYVEGNVVNLTDPSGKIAPWLAAMIFGAIGGAAIGALVGASVAAMLWDMADAEMCGCEAKQWADRTDRAGFIIKTAWTGARLGAVTLALTMTPLAPAVTAVGIALSFGELVVAQRALDRGDTSACTKLLRDLGLIGVVAGMAGSVLGGVSISPSGLAPVTNTGHVFANGISISLTIDASAGTGAAIFGGITYFARQDPDGPYGGGDEDLVDLYHGSREPLEGGKFDLDEAIAHQRETHYTDTEEPGIFFTDDFIRAVKDYGRGFVTKVKVPRWLAEQVRQPDRFSRKVEYKFSDPAYEVYLNQYIETRTVSEALRDLSWWSGG